MKTKQIAVPEEILALFKQSRLGSRAEEDQVRAALAIHLFQEGVISIGKSAKLAGDPRIDFQWLLVQMGIPTVRYELADYERDLESLAEADRRAEARRPTETP